MKISVVIPALDEEGIVGKTVKSIPVDKLKAMGLDTEILIVDNASTDDTANEARNAGARVIHETKRGYGNAYIKGFKEANGDIIVIGDADGTYPWDMIHEFIQPIIKGRVDFVIGSRLKGKIHPKAMPWLHRYVGNPILTFILNWLFGTNISDAHCGMRAFTKEALQKMNLKTPGMEFASEMIIEAAKNKLRITEIPIEYKVRVGEVKLHSFQDGWRHLRFMILYSSSPLFLIPGSMLFLMGLILIGLLLGGPVRLQGNIGLDIHPMILGNLLVILGFQVIT